MCVCDELIALLFFPPMKSYSAKKRSEKESVSIYWPHMDFPQAFFNGFDMDNTVVFVV